MNLLSDLLAVLPALKEAGATSVEIREGSQSVRLRIAQSVPIGPVADGDNVDLDDRPTAYDQKLGFMLNQGSRREAG